MKQRAPTHNPQERENDMETEYILSEETARIEIGNAVQEASHGRGARLEWTFVSASPGEYGAHLSRTIRVYERQGETVYLGPAEPFIEEHVCSHGNIEVEEGDPEVGRPGNRWTCLDCGAEAFDAEVEMSRDEDGNIEYGPLVIIWEPMGERNL